MEGSREKSSGPPPPRADEIPAAIDDVLNRIRVILTFKRKILLIFVLFRWQGRCLGCWWWTRRGCPSRPPWTAPPLPSMGEWWLLCFFQYFLDFSQWLPWSYICFLSAFDNNLKVSRLANTAKSVVRDLDNGLFRISQVFGNFFFYI